MVGLVLTLVPFVSYLWISLVGISDWKVDDIVKTDSPLSGYNGLNLALRIPGFNTSLPFF